MLYNQQQPLTIADTLNAKTAELDLTNKTLVGVFVLATHTAVINVLAVGEDGSDYSVRDSNGTALQIAATAGSGLYDLYGKLPVSARKVKFQSAGTEAATRTIYPVFRQLD